MDTDSGYESVQSDGDTFGSRHLLNKSLLNPRSTEYAVKRTKVEKITQGEQVVRLSEGLRADPKENRRWAMGRGAMLGAGREKQ